MQSKALNENEIIKISKDLLEGISYIESKDRKFILADIKPDNILIDYQGNALLSDFGLVKNL